MCGIFGWIPSRDAWRATECSLTELLPLDRLAAAAAAMGRDPAGSSARAVVANPPYSAAARLSPSVMRLPLRVDPSIEHLCAHHKAETAIA